MKQKHRTRSPRTHLADGPLTGPSTVDRRTLEARILPANNLFLTLMEYMPNPDEILRDTGEAITIYREMRTDARIKSLLTVAKSAVLNFPIHLEQGDASDEVMAATKSAFAPLPLKEIAKNALAAMDYGYAIQELVWKNDAGTWLPEDAVPRKPERFAFAADGRLQLRDIGDGPRDLSSLAFKWIVYRHESDAENPYGTSVLKACYWAWKFKKAGLEFWLMATEKFAVPSILALFESQEGPERIRERAQELAQMLNEVSSGSGAVFANIKDAKIIQTDSKISEFASLMTWCDTQMAYAIVFQSLAVQEAQNGTRAQATVHEDTFLSATKGTCRDLAQVLQDPVDWFVELNYGPGEIAPKVEFDLDDYATWDMICDAVDRGIPLSRSVIYERYGLPLPKNETDSFISPKPPPTQGVVGFSDKVKKKTSPIRPRLNLR